MTVSDIQLKLINKAKEYLKKKTSENVNVHNSARCYFMAWGQTPGYAILKLWQEGYKTIFKSYKIFLKDIISISSFYNYYLINKFEPNKSYNKIIVSWGFRNSFQSDGSYQDKYFKINSKDTKSTLWFLVYDETVLPEKINDDILIFTKSKNTSRFNLIYLFKAILKKLFISKFSVKRFFHKTSSHTEFSDIVWNKLKDFVKKDIDTIIMPYEGQPFQNKIFYKIKKINSKIRTIGYVHTFPCSLPTHYILRDGSPEKLIISGDDQHYCFQKYLNWKNSQLKILPSTRYLKAAESMSGYIYLPMNLPSTDIIIRSLQNLLTTDRKEAVLDLIVRNHPSMKDSKKHIKIIEKINNFLSSYKNSSMKESHESKFSIFIGSTSAPIEALEREVEVIHICDDPVFQCYSSTLWPNIKIKKIDENTYEYKLLKKGKLIKLGDGSKTFLEEYLN